MGLGAFPDEMLAQSFVDAELKQDWDAADRYEDEFFRRRLPRFTDASIDDDNASAMALWLELRRKAGEKD